MTTLLLDADVVIAFTVADHNHERASRWFVTVEQAAVCPVVEGALIRFLVRVGVSATSARALLAALHTATRACSSGPTRFRTQTFAVGHIVGHRPVTDAYLAGVALSRGGRLATLDTALSEALPHAVLLIPQQR